MHEYADDHASCPCIEKTALNLCADMLASTSPTIQQFESLANSLHKLQR